MDNLKSRLHQDIIDYYSAKCESFQQGVQRQTLAIHAGYTDENVQDYAESLVYMNQVLADRVGISPGERVLDAGCGVGGSAIWLAKNRKARVVGISLVARQVEYAARFSREEGASRLVEFSVGDFTAAAFADKSFDVVWAIESACHALDKREFIREAWRVLKPGGRLVAADGFQNHAALPPEDQALMDSWLSSWEVPHLATPEQFFADLRQEGFTSIRFEDATPNVLPFSIRLYQEAILEYARAKGIAALKTLSPAEMDNLHGARDQLQSLSAKLWVYGIIVAAKPKGAHTR